MCIRDSLHEETTVRASGDNLQAGTNMLLDPMGFEIDVALLLPIGMTLETVTFQDWQDILPEVHRLGGEERENQGDRTCDG